VRLGAANEVWPDSPSPIPVSPAEPCWLFSGLPGDDLAALSAVVERLPPGSALNCDDEQPQMVRILLEGWALGCKSLADGRRQILNLMFAGDRASHWTPLSGAHDHKVRALTPCRVLAVRRDDLLALAARQPVLDARLVERSLVDVNVLHAWLLNLGQRKAPERIAHLFCELGHRLDSAVEPGTHAARTLPLTQQDLADVLGMTSVHVNRILQTFRADGFIAIRKGAVLLRDLEGLARTCDFDPGYLLARA
jgi:CRP-like cAMP-binding protein